MSARAPSDARKLLLLSGRNGQAWCPLVSAASACCHARRRGSNASKPLSFAAQVNTPTLSGSKEFSSSIQWRATVCFDIRTLLPTTSAFARRAKPSQHPTQAAAPWTFVRLIHRHDGTASRTPITWDEGIRTAAPAERVRSSVASHRIDMSDPRIPACRFNVPSHDPTQKRIATAMLEPCANLPSSVSERPAWQLLQAKSLWRCII